MRVLLALAAATLATATAATLLAAAQAVPASSTFAVWGLETGFTSTSARFSGIGAGNAREGAVWTVAITRTAFDPSGRSTITGGAFTMKTISAARTTDSVTGTVAGGFVQKTSGFTGCTTEKFAVSVPLTNVATKTTVGGTGAFTGQLTHYRTSIFGACLTYGATITGALALSY